MDCAPDGLLPSESHVICGCVRVCVSVCLCWDSGLGWTLFILQGLLSKSPRLRPAHKASHEIQFVSIICLIFIR